MTDTRMLPTSDFRPDDTIVRISAAIARANGLPAISDLIQLLRDRLVEAEADVKRLDVLDTLREPVVFRTSDGKEIIESCQWRVEERASDIRAALDMMAADLKAENENG